MTVNRFRCFDPSFQNHSRKIADNIIDTLSALSEGTKYNKVINKNSYIDLSKQICGLLCKYILHKKNIPYESKWFKDKRIHKDIYEISGHELDIITKSGTLLQPKIETDHDWFEDNLTQIIVKNINFNFKNKEYQSVVEVLNYLIIYLKCLTENGFTSKAFSILDDLFYSFISVLDIQEKDKNDEPLELVGIFESIVYGYVCIQLIFFNDYLKKSSEKEIRNKIKKIDWNKRSALYKTGLQFHSLKELEWLYSRISFEESIEGRIITPLWYQCSYISYFEASKLKEDILNIVDFSNKRFDKLYDLCKEKKYYWCCSAIISREYEYWNKFSINYKTFKEIWTSLADHNKAIDFYKIELNFDSIEKTIRDKQLKLYGKLIDQSIVLSGLERPNTYPDYAGHFLHLTSYSTFNAICDNNIELLKQLFPKYFLASLDKTQNLYKKINKEGWTIESRMNIANAPILDLLYISGYSKLMSEYHVNPEIWDMVKTTFDKYLEKVPSSQKTLEFIVACIQLADDTFALPFRHEIRFEWQRIIKDILSKLPFVENFDNSFFTREKEIKHDSPLVRWFAAQDMYSHSDGIDIFIYEYLKKRKEKLNLKFNKRYEKLDEILEKEKVKYSNKNNEDDIK